MPWCELRVTDTMQGCICNVRYMPLHKPKEISLKEKLTRPIIPIIALILLSSSGDMEINPGPTDLLTKETIYLCGTCLELVTWEQDSIYCDSCNT